MTDSQKQFLTFDIQTLIQWYLVTVERRAMMAKEYGHTCPPPRPRSEIMDLVTGKPINDDVALTQISAEKAMRTADQWVDELAFALRYHAKQIGQAWFTEMVEKVVSVGHEA